VRAGACTPAATVNRGERSTAPHAVIAVVIGPWRLAFVVDADPTTGMLRDLGATVAAMTGCDGAAALAAVLDGVVARPAPTLEDAA
jgi:hypothetical protein